MRLLLVMAIAAVASWPVAAEKSDLEKTLPDEKVLTGWRARPWTLRYGKGDRLFEIYAGGAGYYRDKGVVEAIQMTYERGRSLLVLTTNALGGPEKALAMFNSWKRVTERRKAFRPLELRDAAGMAMEPGGAIGFLVSGNYLVRAQVVMTETEAPEELARVLRVLTRLVGNRRTADNGRR